MTISSKLSKSNRSLVATALGFVLLAVPVQFATAVDCAPYLIRWFGCDNGHDNPQCGIQRDGTPHCGTRNCPQSPGQCWYPGIQSFSHGGDPNWTSHSNGTIDLGHGRDYNVYGRAYLYSDADRVITIGVQGDTLLMWINNAQVSCSGGGTRAISLHAGRNVWEFTGSNQNQGNHIVLSFPTIAGVFACSEAITCLPDLNSDGFINFADFDLFVALFEQGSAASDFNGDGFLDFSDFDTFVTAFERGC